MTENTILLGSADKSRAANRTVLALEDLVLRQQPAILNRTRPHPRLRRRDRLFWVWLSQV